LKTKDVTLAIILSAVAVEGQMAYLFFKWRKVDNFTYEIAQQWEKDWIEMRIDREKDGRIVKVFDRG
jgi:hypothetical protein